MSDLTYVPTGDNYTVVVRGQQIGRVRKLGMYWHAYELDGTLIRGTFGSMSAAGQRVAEQSVPPKKKST